jgi:hypothetical protein
MVRGILIYAGVFLVLLVLVVEVVIARFARQRELAELTDRTAERRPHGAARVMSHMGISALEPWSFAPRS